MSDFDDRARAKIVAHYSRTQRDRRKTRQRINFIRGMSHGFARFIDNWRSGADKIAGIKGRNIDAKLTRSIKAGGTKRTGWAAERRRVVGDFRRLAAAKSEIDCSAITIRALSRETGFDRSDALPCRRNICECIFPDIPDGSHAAIRLLPESRQFRFDATIPRTRHRDRYLPHAQCAWRYTARVALQRRRYILPSEIYVPTMNLLEKRGTVLAIPTSLKKRWRECTAREDTVLKEYFFSDVIWTRCYFLLSINFINFLSRSFSQDLIFMYENGLINQPVFLSETLAD